MFDIYKVAFILRQFFLFQTYSHMTISSIFKSKIILNLISRHLTKHIVV